MVAIAVIAVVLTIGLYFLQASRESARRTQCYRNLYQIGLALQNYESNYGAFPMGYMSVTNESGAEVGTGWAWGTAMLPYIEQMAMFNAVNFYLPVTDPTARTARTVEVNAYLCPSSLNPAPVVARAPAKGGSAKPILDDLAPADYVGSAGQRSQKATGDGDGVFFRSSSVTSKAITDGLASTFLVGERSRLLSDVAWSGVVTGSEVCTAPSWPTRDCASADALVLGWTGPSGFNSPQPKADDFHGPHGDGGFFVFADASVHFVKQSISPKVFTALSTRAGGEKIGSDEY